MTPRATPADIVRRALASACAETPPSRSRSTPRTANIPGAFEGETVTRRRFMVGHRATAPAPSPTAAFAAPGARLRGRARRSSSGRPCAGRRSASSTTSRTTPTCPRVITIVRRHRRGRQDHGLRAQAQPEDRQAAEPAGLRRAGRRDLHALHAPRLPGPLRRRPRSASSARATAASTTSSGMVVGGPPVRPLDRFYTRVAQRPASRSARATRVNTELERFDSPRDPARTSTASASTSTRRASRPRSPRAA